MDMRGMKKISREERRRKARETAERNKKIELAMKEVVENGMALRAAAKAYDVRRSTLQDHLKRPARQEPHHPKNTTFSAEQEAVLLEHIRNMAAIGYGYTPFQIIDLAQNMSRLLDHGGNKLKQRLPNEKWWQEFKKRHPDYGCVRPKKRTTARVAVTPEIITSYFAKLVDAMQIVGCTDTPVDIWNLDETGVSLDHNPPKIYTCLKDKVFSITAGKSPTTTLVSAVNAIGECLPPFFIFKGVRVTEEMKAGILDGTEFRGSETGWINSVIFIDFIVNHFAKHVKRRPCLILYDGHSTHYPSEVIVRCREMGIYLFVLPPNTTHVLQPLDVGVFGPFKKALYANIQEWMLAHPYRLLQRHELPGMICQTLKQSMTDDTIVKAFRKCGIFPLSADAVKLSVIAGPVAAIKPKKQDTVQMKVVLDGVTECFTSEKKSFSRKRRATIIPSDGTMITSDEFLEAKLQQEEAQRKKKESKGNYFTCKIMYLKNMVKYIL